MLQRDGFASRCTLKALLESVEVHGYVVGLLDAVRFLWVVMIHEIHTYQKGGLKSKDGRGTEGERK